MSKHDNWEVRIRHIIEAIKKSQSYVADIDEEEFYEDERTMQAVERNFEIIGEATRHIPDNIKDKYTIIPWRKMSAMRNFIIHQYNDIEEHVLWNTVQKDLPPLLVQLEKLLEELKRNG